MRRWIVSGFAIVAVLFPISSLNAQTPPDVFTGRGLTRAALRRIDVRGFVLTSDGERLDKDLTAVASYQAARSAPQPGSSCLLIVDELKTWGSADEASAELESGAENASVGSDHRKNENDGSVGMGDEDVALYSLFHGGDEYAIHFRRATVTVAVTIYDPLGTDSWEHIIALALIVDARLQGIVIA